MSKARSNVWKLRDIVDATDPAFGAKGDGATDDQAAITAALASADTTVLPSGKTFLVKSGVTVPTNKSLYAVGAETSAYGATVAGDRGKAILYADQAAFVGTAVLTLSTRSSACELTVTGAAGVNCIKLGNNTALRGVRATKGQYGLDVSNVGGIQLTDVQADGCGNGMFSSAGGTDIQATNCVFSNNTSIGVLLNPGAGQIAFENTRFEWNGAAGVQLFDVTGGVTFGSSCVFDRNGEAGARIQGTSSNVVFASGVRYARNGATTANAALKVHISLEGTGSEIRIGQGNWIATHVNDDGTGIIAPEYCFSATGTMSQIHLDDQPPAQNTGVFYDAATQTVMARNRLVQKQEATLAAVATGTTVIPQDDSIPQNTEGDEYLTVSITPRRSTNRLLIEAVVPCSHSAATSIVAALFKDAIADALSVTWAYQGTATGGVILTVQHEMQAGSIAAATFKLRVGGVGAGTTTVNGSGGARYFGGVLKTYLRVTEYEGY